MSKYLELDDELHSYLVSVGSRQDEVLRAVETETAEMGDAAVMQISPDQGAFMTLITQLVGAREALEIGTFTGYSAICIARGLAPGGRLLCCELDEGFAEIAARNLERAGVAGRTEIRIGPALETLRALPEREVFDLVFIDADKPSYADYYEQALLRTRPGGLIMLDNMLYGGGVVDRSGERARALLSAGEVVERRAENARAIDDLNRALAADQRIDLATVAIADGIALARKR